MESLIELKKKYQEDCQPLQEQLGGINRNYDKDTMKWQQDNADMIVFCIWQKPQDDQSIESKFLEIIFTDRAAAKESIKMPV